MDSSVKSQFLINGIFCITKQGFVLGGFGLFLTIFFIVCCISSVQCRKKPYSLGIRKNKGNSFRWEFCYEIKCFFNPSQGTALVYFFSFSCWSGNQIGKVKTCTSKYGGIRHSPLPNLFVGLASLMVPIFI